MTLYGNFTALGLAVCLSAASCMTAFAGHWEQNGTEWKYQNDDGSYAAGWNWIDGNGDGISECYYMNADGIMLVGAITPDGYTVNENGAWVADGVVQTRTATGEARGDGSALPFKTDFIKQEYKDCYGKDLAYILNTFGEPLEAPRTSTVRFGDYEPFLIEVVLYKNVAITLTNSKVSALSCVRGDKYELFNATKDDYTIQELDDLLGVKSEESSSWYTWRLNEDPSIELEYSRSGFRLQYTY